MLAYVLLAIAGLWILWLYRTYKPMLAEQKATGLGAVAGLPGFLISRYVPPHRQLHAAVAFGVFATLGWIVPFAIGLVLLLR